MKARICLSKNLTLSAGTGHRANLGLYYSGGLPVRERVFKTKTMTILLVLFFALLVWAISDNGKENRRFLDYREREARDFEK